METTEEKRTLNEETRGKVKFIIFKLSRSIASPLSHPATPIGV
jgi:hypothetical protein